jgi:hypothetical protein
MQGGQSPTLKDHRPIRSLTRNLARSAIGFIALASISGRPPVMAVRLSSPSQVLILPGGGTRAATELKATVWCSETRPSKGMAALTWKVAEEPGIEQRVDFSMYRDGFERAAFETTGPVAPRQSSVQVDGLEPGINYYWRVLTRTSVGWVTSETARCEGLTCPR